MITRGVDLAAMPERTALASIEWTAERAIIRDVVRPAEDEAILEAIEQADKTGIDCPLGSPTAFVDFVAAHRAGHVGIPEDRPGWRRDLTMRRTDIFVREQMGLVPLSVSADRIAHVALRCAVLLARLDPSDPSGAATQPDRPQPHGQIRTGPPSGPGRTRAVGGQIVHICRREHVRAALARPRPARMTR